jgi:hypothetical protein
VRRLAIVLLVLVVAIGAFLFFPRGGTLSAASAATLSVLHGTVEAQKGAAAFAPALDGDLVSSGDSVRADGAGNAVVSFFDGSTLTVEPGAQVRIASLAKSGSGGIQVTIEQTLGRTWASVSRLTADGRFEVRTPTATAAVRGTAFETVVETVNGVTTTTVKTTEGVVLVQAQAGGEVSVPAGAQVQVPQGGAAPPAPAPLPVGPRLRLSSTAGVGYTVFDPRGLRCGAADRQIPGCDVQGGVVTIADPPAGTYAVALTAAAAVRGATLTAEAGRGGSVEQTQRFTTDLALGDLVRTSFSVSLPAGGPLGLSSFSAPELVTSVCGAEARGRVFSAGPVDARGDALRAYARSSPKQPAAIVLGATELSAAAAKATAGADLPVTVSNVSVTIDPSGLHLAAQAAAGPITVPATASIIAGTDGGKLVLRTRDLDLGPVPGAAKDQLLGALDRGLTDFAGQFPLVVERVAFRSGCMAIIGTTP